MVRCANSLDGSGESGGETSKSGLPVEGFEAPGLEESVVLELALSGYSTPSKIAGKTGWGVEEIRRVWNDPKFQLALLAARRDMSVFVVGWVKKHSLEYAQQMHALATKGDDERVRFQANKDLLDRAGTGGQTKIALGSPQQYKQVVEELAEEGEVNGVHGV